MAANQSSYQKGLRMLYKLKTRCGCGAFVLLTRFTSLLGVGGGRGERETSDSHLQNRAPAWGSHKGPPFRSELCHPESSW